MKKIILSIGLSIIGLYTYGQISWSYSPVTKITEKVTYSNDTTDIISFYKVKFTATIDPEWHIYSMYQDSVASIRQATKFTCDSLMGMSEKGNMIIDKESFFTNFQYENKVIFKLYFYPSSTAGIISVLYQACTKDTCLLPETQIFKLKLP